MVELKVPEFGESIQEVQISQWLKQEGEWVDRDEDLVELETEKASQALGAPAAGVVKRLVKAAGEFAQVGDLIAEIDETATAPVPAETASSAAAAPAPDGQTQAAQATAVESPPTPATRWIMPAAERMLEEYKIAADVVTPTGPGGRLLKEDVIRYIEAHGLQPGGRKAAEPAPAPLAPSSPAPSSPASRSSEPSSAQVLSEERREDVKPMSMIRRTIASRLVEAQQQAALLTTFNEIDMQPVIELRTRYKEQFLDKHGVKLGFMSFFAKASVEALKRFPAINSEIRGNDIVQRNYYDIGIAIGGGKGLVVPILRDVQRLSFAEIEMKIGEYGQLATSNKIQPADLEGGTFTISNGGIYGSLLSTPIVNPPQSGILGLHAIQERPVAREGQVVIRPMMYVALTYDHRIVDGREAVGFLRTIKDVLEEPARLFLEV